MDLENSTKFYLIELNLISAQELKRVGRATEMQTYVVAWINPEKKLTSRVDVAGGENPTWNDKFVFVIDDQTLSNIYSTLVFDIYCVRFCRKDKRIGTVKILVDNLIGSSNRYYDGLRGTFRAFQVRRPSGKPQGILNIGVIFLDGLFNQVMNECVGLSSAIDYRVLMGKTKEDIKKRGGFPKKDLGMKGVFCGLIPAKRRFPKKIHQWPCLV